MTDNPHSDLSGNEAEDPAGKNQVDLGRGRSLRVTMLNRADAAAVANALARPGMLDVLAVIGRIDELSESDRGLALALMGRV